MMSPKLILPLSVTLALCLVAASQPHTSAANVMNYGADGNDYFQFTPPSIPLHKASGFTTLIAYAMHVNPNGIIEGNGAVPAAPTGLVRLSPPSPPSIPPLTRQIFITNNLLNLPVNNNGPSRRVTIIVGGIPVRDFDINLADGAADWWAFVDV
ncbi:MAG TPA: hypothetical protein VMH30_00475, partial [Verrucomicrobiae bacterium]|nr:hypothetical protein [Verrucomicrobiae bacterium]